MEENIKKDVGAEGAPAAENQISFEELNANYMELNVGYQKLVAAHRKLMAEHQQAMDALQNRDFDYMSFFLSMLFKVMDHPNKYDVKFVDWAVQNIQSTLIGFSESLRQQPAQDKDGENGEDGVGDEKKLQS